MGMVGERTHRTGSTGMDFVSEPTGNKIGHNQIDCAYEEVVLEIGKIGGAVVVVVDWLRY